LNRVLALACVVLWPLVGQVGSPSAELFGPDATPRAHLWYADRLNDAWSTPVLAQPARVPDVRYVANSGMLVMVSGRRFLIDAPIRVGIPPYATSSAEERARLEEARAPYDNVDAILITHWHEDHFSPEAVAAHLSRSARTIVISSPEVIERLRSVAPALPASRVRALLPAPGSAEQVDVGGVPVRVLRVRHNPTRRLPEQHVAFLVGAAETVLHVGDADPAADNFAAEAVAAYRCRPAAVLVRVRRWQSPIRRRFDPPAPHRRDARPARRCGEGCGGAARGERQCRTGGDSGLTRRARALSRRRLTCWRAPSGRRNHGGTPRASG
jgi:glyoxylase-like metal-dependent hydrolase (beta-lactamase superfamily II)